MRAVVQRVNHAAVAVDGAVVSSIGQGLLILLGVEDIDTSDDRQWLAGKIALMRIFSDETGKMNRSVIDSGGEVLVVSQFTLLASTEKGNRPSYIRAARPEQAIPHYEAFCREVAQHLKREVKCGVFGADMKVSLENDGPVTIVIDSHHRE